MFLGLEVDFTGSLKLFKMAFHYIINTTFLIILQFTYFMLLHMYFKFILVYLQFHSLKSHYYYYILAFGQIWWLPHVVLRRPYSIAADQTYSFCVCSSVLSHLYTSHNIFIDLNWVCMNIHIPSCQCNIHTLLLPCFWTLVLLTICSH